MRQVQLSQRTEYLSEQVARGVNRSEVPTCSPRDGERCNISPLGLSSQTHRVQHGHMPSESPWVQLDCKKRKGR